MACYSVLTEQKAMKAIERPLQLLPPCFARKQVSAPGSTAIPLLLQLLQDFQITFRLISLLTNTVKTNSLNPPKKIPC